MLRYHILPNTLAHIALNGPVSRSLVKGSDILWIYLGCVIPDIPWIIRKIIEFIAPSINGYDLQIYSIVQSTLIFSLILSFGFALVSNSRRKTFLILGIGTILHLVFDMLQIKWANGVLLFAPLNWEIINYGIFWPESIITYIFTLSGLVYYLIHWKRIKLAKLPLRINIGTLIGLLMIMILYFGAPIFFMDESRSADNHFVNTLENENEREGKYIEMDRKDILFNENTNSFWIKSFDKSYIELSEMQSITSNRISIKGTFTTNNLIKVYEYHENNEILRDGASYMGLLLILLAWGISFKNYF